MRWIIPLALVLAACSSDPQPTAPTTTTVDQTAGDRALIVGMFRHISDSWFDGTRAGVEAMVASQYPGTGYTVEQCIDYLFDGQLPEGMQYEEIVDQATIQPDPTWAVPAGPLDGQVPEGRTYIMSVHATTTADGIAPQEATAEVHATVLDGKAYQHPNCG